MKKRENVVVDDDLPKFITPDPNGLPRVVKKIQKDENARHMLGRRGNLNETVSLTKEKSAQRVREEEDLDLVELPVLVTNKKNSYKVEKDEEKKILEEEVPTITETKEPSKLLNDKKVRIIVYMILFCCLLLALYCVTRINMWRNENDANLKQLENIKELTYEREITSDDVVNVIKSEKNESKEGKLLETDFSKLKDINDDTVAFMKVAGLDLSVPVVQTGDNSFYLSHDFNKNNNSNGWIFGDYRNDWDNLKANTIIYGHNRRNYTMFGTLKLMLEQKWYGNKNNHYINISTENKNMLFQIFSVYTIPTETYYLANDFKTEEAHHKFIDTISSRSRLSFDAKPDITDKILTLSTCYSSSEKLVIHAKLIKYQEK